MLSVHIMSACVVCGSENHTDINCSKLSNCNYYEGGQLDLKFAWYHQQFCKLMLFADWDISQSSPAVLLGLNCRGTGVSGYLEKRPLWNSIGSSWNSTLFGLLPKLDHGTCLHHHNLNQVNTNPQHYSIKWTGVSRITTENGESRFTVWWNPAEFLDEQ